MKGKSLDLSKFSQDDLKKLGAQVLSKIKNPEQGIGRELFDAMIKITPKLGVEAVVVDNVDNPTKVLLIKRDSKCPYYAGTWHITGGFVRYSKNILETAEEIIKRELDCGVKKFKNTGRLFSFVDTRGHTITLICLVEIKNKPKDGKWFISMPNPKKMIPHQILALREIFNWR